jgi:hypothetical protein
MPPPPPSPSSSSSSSSSSPPSSSTSSATTTRPRWLIPPEVLQPYCKRPALEFPACTARSPHAYNDARPLAGKGELWARNVRWILPSNSEFQAIWRDLLHAANLRHGTDSFTSSPKEGMLRIFLILKNPTASGSNPRTLVPDTSMLTPRPPKPHPIIPYTLYHNSYCQTGPSRSVFWPFRVGKKKYLYSELMTGDI